MSCEMELSYSKINLAAAEDRQQPPGDVVKRSHPAEIWHVPFSPLNLVDPPDWRHVKRDNNVYIPLFPYLVSNDPANALGFAFQLGVRAIHDLGGQPVQRLHLAIGDPVNQVHDQASGELVWQFYLGFGVVLA